MLQTLTLTMTPTLIPEVKTPKRDRRKPKHLHKKRGPPPDEILQERIETIVLRPVPEGYDRLRVGQQCFWQHRQGKITLREAAEILRWTSKTITVLLHGQTRVKKRILYKNTLIYQTIRRENAAISHWRLDSFRSSPSSDMIEIL